MRHRKRGRVLGRSPSHRRALFRNLAAALFLTERGDDWYQGLFQPDGREVKAPKVKGRITTTLHKAKEVRSLVEKCITIARKGLLAEENARQYAATAERGSEPWKAWRNSPQWRDWARAKAPAVAARRHVLRLIRDREAVNLLFDVVAPRFMDRPGGYTRVLKLAQPRLGDAGAQAILEFVGVRDRVVQRSQAPRFDDQPAAEPQPAVQE